MNNVIEVISQIAVVIALIVLAEMLLLVNILLASLICMIIKERWLWFKEKFKKV